MIPLGQESIAVYDVIERHYSLCGQSPTIPQIVTETGFSKSGIAYHLKRLEQAGWITREFHQLHAIIPIKYPRVHYRAADAAGWVFAAPDYTNRCPACDRYACAVQKSNGDDSPSGRNPDAYIIRYRGIEFNVNPNPDLHAQRQPDDYPHARADADSLAD